MNFFNEISPLVLKLLAEGKSLDALIKSYPERQLSSSNFFIKKSKNDRFRTAINEGGEQVAIIPLYGTMTKHGGLCSYGTSEIASMIHEANASNDVNSILIDVNSHGGAGNSVEILQNAIEKSQKPVVAWVDQMSASAALWATAGADKILIDSTLNSVMGSIGTLVIHHNRIAQLHNDGIKVEIIRAPQSTDKARLNDVEEITDQVRAELLAELKNYNEAFISDVKRLRGHALSTSEPRMYTGATFDGKQALALGFADEQAEFSDAIGMALDMSKSQNKNSIFINNMNMFKRLSLSFELAKKLTAEELKNIAEAEEKLEALEKENAELKAHNDTLTQEVTNQTASLKEANAEIKALGAQLANSSAAPATTVVSDSDKGNEYKEEKKLTSWEKKAIQKVGYVTV